MKSVSRKTHTVILYLVFFTVVFFTCGCIEQMPLNKKTESLNLTEKSIAIFTLKTSNVHNPSYQPEVQRIDFISKETKKKTSFAVWGAHSKESKSYYEYLVSADLIPGEYTIGEVAGLSNNILIIGNFCFPVEAEFEILPDSIVYLGHIEMINRKKQKGEKASGGIFPLVDQAVSGYSGSTFDITITDRSEMDIPMFHEEFPILQEHIINRNIIQKM